MGLLTVRENIYFSATLRLPSSMSSEEKGQKVDKLIDELGLSKVANSKVKYAFIACNQVGCFRFGLVKVFFGLDKRVICHGLIT